MTPPRPPLKWEGDPVPVNNERSYLYNIDFHTINNEFVIKFWQNFSLPFKGRVRGGVININRRLNGFTGMIAITQ